MYNLIGQNVFEYTQSGLSKGAHVLDFDASNLSSGIYIYEINATGSNGQKYRGSEKMIISR